MLIFISDLHLRPGPGRLTRAAQFDRLRRLLETRPDGDGPVRLCLLGDVFDLVRAPVWLAGTDRPYHEPSEALAARVSAIVGETLRDEAPFFDTVRAGVASGALEVHYLLGNHDRLLAHAPAARAAVRAALGMPGGDAPLPWTLVFPEEGVLAYHGHVVDQLCYDASGAAPLGDMVASELIVRFPGEIRRRMAVDDPRLDEIDDVRPVLAVPGWVQSLAQDRDDDLKPVVVGVWRELVEEFLENPHVKGWLREHHGPMRLDFAQRFRLLLTLSARAAPRDVPRTTTLYYALMRLLDVRLAHGAVKRLELPEHRRLRYVVNGHTHFAGMRPLGLVNGQPACYFNTGTWRTLHQLGDVARGRPAFMAFDAAAYLVFFGKGDPLGRSFEWWQGAGG